MRLLGSLSKLLQLTQYNAHVRRLHPAVAGNLTT